MINSETKPGYYTLAEGQPYADASTTVQLKNNIGGGLSLLQDTQLIETLAHFSRERIPERVVHAKAAGARGYFEVTHDNSDITCADFLNGIGKRSEILLRVSTVGPEAGSADSVRDVRGWGMKIKTAEGNQDWVFNDTPIFFVRDPVKFPSQNRSHKRHPATHLTDANIFWDFHVGNPEGMHALTFLFSDRGTPASVRHINAYSGHTYKFCKADGSFVYVKIHIKTDQGIKTLTQKQAVEMAGADPDHHIKDLYESIEAGDYPSWTVYVQVMQPKDAETYRWNIFDMTKVWPQADYPLRQIGRMVLDTRPKNYFAEIEQAAFSPSNMVPGIAPSADPMLQARMFAYPDAARYRLGANYQFLPTNAPVSPVYTPTQRDGAMNFTANYGGDPNYVGSMLKPMTFLSSKSKSSPTTNGTVSYTTPTTAKASYNALATLTEHEAWAGSVSNFTTTITDDDFAQPAALWRVIGREQGHQQRFIANLASHVAGVTLDELREAVYALWKRVDGELGERLEKETRRLVKLHANPEMEGLVRKISNHHI